jgi:hypothetical protein
VGVDLAEGTPAVPPLQALCRAILPHPTLIMTDD